MIYIKDIQAEVLPNHVGTVYFISSITGEVQREDYINLNGFQAYLQNFSRIEETEFIETPLVIGLQNTNNLPTITLEISY